MNDPANRQAYGVLIEPATLRIERRLPGPIERVWAYLTDSDLRRRWLASGAMETKVGTAFEFVWRNDELTDPPGQRPAGFPQERRMQGRVLACEPPHKLTISWGVDSEVSFALDPQGDDVRLTLIHRRLPDRATILNVAAGWHMHLDTWVAEATAQPKAPFWDGWNRLRNDYERLLPA